MIPDLLALERKLGTAATLRACRDYIKAHRQEKAALRQIGRGKGPKGSNRKSGYLKARRECDKAFSAMIKRSYDGCHIHWVAHCLGITLPVKCGNKLVCFHLIPKASSEALRFDLDNAVQSCSGANFHESLHRGDWEKLLEKLYPERMARLREKMKWPSVKRNEAMLQRMTAEFNSR